MHRCQLLWFFFVWLFLLTLGASRTLKCQQGNRRGPCQFCTCEDGFELSPSEHADKCPVCRPCIGYTFSNDETGHQCVECSTPCEEMNTLTIQACNGSHNVQCGACREGFYRRFLFSEECYPCTEETKDIQECQLIYHLSTKEATFTTKKTNSTNTSTPSNVHSGESVLMVSMLCVIAVILGISIGFTFMYFWRKCNNSSSYIFGSTSTTSSTRSTNMLTKDIRIDEIKADDAMQEEDKLLNETRQLDDDLAIDVDLDEEEENPKFPDGMVDRNGILLNRISKRIDRDPHDVYKKLGIEGYTIFQSRKNWETQRSDGDIVELYLSVLQKWVEINAKEATAMKLYKAFSAAKMNAVCKVIVDTCQITR